MTTLERDRAQEARREARAMRQRAYLRIGPRLGWHGFCAAVFAFTPVV